MRLGCIIPDSEHGAQVVQNIVERLLQVLQDVGRIRLELRRKRRRFIINGLCVILISARSECGGRERNEEEAIKWHEQRDGAQSGVWINSR